MKRYAAILFFLFVGLFGCISQPNPTITLSIGWVSQTPTPSISSSSTITKSAISTVTPDSVSATLTPTATRLPPTATVTPEGQAIFRELKEISTLPETAMVTGSIVLASPRKVDSFYLLDSQQITIWNLQTHVQQPLLASNDQHASDISISPNGAWLAYSKRTPMQNSLNRISLHIVSANGQEQMSRPWEDGWGALALWLDNEHLVIRRDSGGDPGRSTFTAKWLLNPFTGVAKELPGDPQDIYSLFPKPQWQGIGMVSYNPGFTHRVYLSIESELIIDNLQTHQSQGVMQINTWESIPRWSPGGNELAIAAPPKGRKDPSSQHFDLFLVAVDGKITRLTHLTDEFGDYCNIHYTSWSPDGREIAFWLSTTDFNTDRARLAVLDLKSGKVMIYPGIESSFDADQQIVWDPHGRYLLTGIVSPDYSRVDTVMVDLTEGWYTRIAENSTPMGWMVDKP